MALKTAMDTGGTLNSHLEAMLTALHAHERPALPPASTTGAGLLAPDRHRQTWWGGDESADVPVHSAGLLAAHQRVVGPVT